MNCEATNSTTTESPVEDRISVAVERNMITCTLPPNATAGDEDVSWTLHRGDFNPQRASKPAQGGSRWTVELPDITNGFAVRARVNGKIYQSPWIQHFKEEAVQRYEAWRSSRDKEPHEIPEELSLFGYEDPFSNIAIICHDNRVTPHNLTALADKHGLFLGRYTGTYWNNLEVLSSASPGVDSTGSSFIFSGVTRNEDRLLFGHTDALESLSEIDSLGDSIGEYHLLSWRADRISFSHDYIGQGRLYYYQSDTLFAAANGIHLLARLLRGLGVELSLDLTSIKSKFFSTTYPFEFQHGPRTDFNEISRLSVYERIEIDSSGLRFPKTELWTDGLDKDFEEASYESLLSEAASDIVSNIRVALEHPRFENVVVELTAGLDSRIIYSALTNIPGQSDKLRISTRVNPEEKTAAAINNLYHFPWDDLPRDYSWSRPSDESTLPRSSHSVFMDGYYIDPMFRPRANYKSPTLVLSGHGGEAFSRVMSVAGYFARDFKGDLPGAYYDLEEVFRDLFKWVGNHQVWHAAGEEHFRTILRESFERTPSDYFPKKFEDLYVSERNPFVCGSVFRGAMAAPQWRPLHSKALFRLRSLWFGQRQDYRIQFDLIRLLNPLVGEVPYTQPVEIARKREYENYQPAFTLKSPIQYDYSTESLGDARRVASSSSTWLPDKDSFEVTKEAVNSYQESSESFLQPLDVILRLAPELEDMGLPVFAYVDRVVNRTRPRAFPKRHNIRNKLHILMHEVLLAKT